jgi:tight adherence protein C
MNALASLFELETMILLLVGLAAFATVITVFAPAFEGDKLRTRIKAVNVERDKLRSAQRAQLNAATSPRLREKQKKSLYGVLVEGLNLRKIFQADESRDALRMAGLRSEKHLVTFLASRIIAPLVLSLMALFYANLLLADRPMAWKLAAMGAGLVLGYMLPGLMVQNYVKRRQTSIRRAWSDALDLLLICVESGMALEPSMARVSKEIGSQSVPLAEEMTLTVAELSYLQDRRKALDNLGKRTGLDTVKAVVTSLVQAERYGTPLGTALRALAQENRDTRMAEAERKAAALGPKLTVPMMIFFMPVIFVVLLTPAVIKVMETSSGG